MAKGCSTSAQKITHAGVLPTHAKAGFTLAEVLITLGIIGVVVAMTIPNLISNIADLQYRTAQKKVRMDIEQACRRLASDGELTDASDTEDFVKNYLSKYVKIIQTCDNNNLEKCGIVTGTNKIYIGKEKDLAQSPITVTMPKLMSDITTNGEYIDKSSKSYGFVFGNGYAANLFYNKNCQDVDVLNAPVSYKLFMQDLVCVNVIFDINGLASPNVTGKDISFVTVFYPNSGLTVAPNVYRADTPSGTGTMGNALCSKLCPNCVPLSFEDYGAMTFNNFMFPPRYGSSYHLSESKGFGTDVAYSGYLQAYPRNQYRPFRCKILY